MEAVETALGQAEAHPRVDVSNKLYSHPCSLRIALHDFVSFQSPLLLGLR